jgi:hypothetical protein
VTKNYRNRIFGILQSRIDATRDTLRYAAIMNLPRVPASDPWHVRGTWPRSKAAPPKWRNEWTHEARSSTPVLVGDRELLVTDGSASYPAAVLIVGPDQGYTALIRTPDFDRLYRDGVPRGWIAERSRRDQITRERDFTRVHNELVRSAQSRGLSEGQAALEANDRMEELGFLPRDPVVVARRIDGATGEPVFEIPSAYFEVGLFRDIAAAVAAPGESVDTGTGDYLKYYDDDVGPRLREYRSTHSSFIVRVDGRTYRLDVTGSP